MNKFKVTYISSDGTGTIMAKIYNGWTFSSYLSDFSANGFYEIQEHNILKIEKLIEAHTENTQDFSS